MTTARSLADITHLTFDCYGTLIDWERGILDAVTPVLARHGVAADASDILRTFVAAEAALEAGPYRRYRVVLHEAMRAIGGRFGIAPSESECAVLPDSLAHWPAFGDTVETLARLRARYTLVVLSNVDDDLFAATARALGSPFAEVITAQQVGSYKPARAHFDVALERLGVARQRILHCAQSLFHDHAPAQALGFMSCHVDRPSLLRATGLAPPSAITPDYRVQSLAALDALLTPR
jgi:2-haloacid dehalogenase